MFQRLFGRNRGPEPVEPPQGQVPAGTRVYAIGDIHGRLDLLRALEDRIVEDRRNQSPARAVLVYLGDYIDRGFESRAVLDHLLQPALPGFERVCLKGNHEDFLLKFLEDTQVGPVWLVNGGRETLMSYGVAQPASLGFTEEGLAEIQESLRQEVPAAHLEFMGALPLTHREGDYFFVHAGVRPGVPIDAQQESDLIWIRDAFLKSKESHGSIVVHGHTPVAEPEVRPNRIGIDTGAFASGRLTCLVLEGQSFRFLST